MRKLQNGKAAPRLALEEHLIAFLRQLRLSSGYVSFVYIISVYPHLSVQIACVCAKDAK